MDKFFKIGMKSFLMALLFYAITLLLAMFILSPFINSEIIIIAIAIMFTLFFCTYLIIDTIKEIVVSNKK